MGRLAQKQLAEGLVRIDSSQFLGKHKVWHYQFTLYQGIILPLKVCEIPSLIASRMAVQYLNQEVAGPAPLLL